MTTRALHTELLTLLVDAAFWQHVGQPDRMAPGRIYWLSQLLYHQVGCGEAATVRRPSRLNPVSTTRAARRTTPK